MTPTEFRFHILELFMWCLRIVLVLAAIAVMYFVWESLAKAADIECKSEPDKQSGWAWRYVEPHNQTKCWYRGTKMIPKSELHWRGAVAKRRTTNYLKLAQPSHDGNGNLAHLPGRLIDVPTKNEIDEAADPIPDVIENRPFGVWEERIGGQFK